MVVTANELNALSKQVLDSAFFVHKELGPGLLESTYEACLAYELESQGLPVEVQVVCPVVYRGLQLTDYAYRLDLLIANELIIELKAVSTLLPIHKAQLLSYLRHSGKRLGLLINFNTVLLKDGLARVVNGL